VLNKSFESLLETYNYSVMYQFWTLTGWTESFQPQNHWQYSDEQVIIAGVTGWIQVVVRGKWH